MGRGSDGIIIIVEWRARAWLAFMRYWKCNRSPDALGRYRNYVFAYSVPMSIHFYGNNSHVTVDVIVCLNKCPVMWYAYLFFTRER